MNGERQLISSYKFLWNGADITSTLNIKSISIDDDMGLEADSMEIVLYNEDNKYLDYFVQGDDVKIDFVFDNGKTFSTGLFFVATIGGIIGSNNEHRLGLISVPMDSPGIRNQMSYARKNVTLKTLLSDVCKKANLVLVYRLMRNPALPWNIKLKNVSHTDEKVGEIITEYASTFNVILKIHNEQLIFSDKKSYLLDPPVYTFNPYSDPIEDFTYEMNWNLYSQYDVKYYNPKTGMVTSDKKTKKSTITTKSETIKKINSKISDPDMARAIAMSVDDQFEFRVSFSTYDNPDLVAGNVVMITDLGNFSGPYLITKSSHDYQTSWKDTIEAISLF